MKHVGKKPSGLSPSVEALVAHERVLPVQSEDVRARILSRAHAATLAGPPATEPMPVTRVGAGQSLAAGSVAVAVAAGVAAAIYLFGGSTPSAPVPKAPVTATPTAVTLPEPSSAPASASDTAPAAPSARAQPVETPVPGARPTASRQESGPEEIQLLSDARQADARRDYAAVLSIWSEHERKFPGGRLSEEREVLRVKALVGLGRTDQARRTASRFRRQFPRSVLLHKVDEMLASKP